MAQARPVGIRIPRPYDTEEEFIRGDGLAIGRLGMILIGAPKRPPGITIRFEVLLKNGEPVFRGEGRVVAHRIHANGREGLEIRFTRLDSRSKALVEQVLNLRRSGALSAQADATPLPKSESTFSKKEPVQRSVPSQKPKGEAVLDTSESSTPNRPEFRSVTEEVLDSAEFSPVDSSRSVSVSTEPEGSVEQSEANESPAESEVSEVEVIEVVPVEIPIRSVPPPPPPIAYGRVGRPKAMTLDDEDVEDVEEIEDVEEVLDEDPTPFAPPVMLEQLEEPSSFREPIEDPNSTQEPLEEPSPRQEAVEAFQATPLPDSEVCAEVLSKLRERQSTFEAPPSVEEALDRLRRRAKAAS